MEIPFRLMKMIMTGLGFINNYFIFLIFYELDNKKSASKRYLSNHPDYKGKTHRKKSRLKEHYSRRS